MAAEGPRFLSERELDAVTSGVLAMDLELAAEAQGPDATTETQGSVQIGQTTVRRIAVDADAPAAARARLLGDQRAEVGIAHGSAQAAGASGADCGANVTTSGADYVRSMQSRAVTPTAATCNCTVLAIAILPQ